MNNRSPVSLSFSDWLFIVIVDIIALLLVAALILGFTFLIVLIRKELL